MSGNRQLKVFLCHSKDDKQKVRELYRRLVADGFDAWFDEEKLMPGQDWDLEIKKAVRNSDIVVVCLSSSSTTKEGYVQKEIRLALDVADEKPEGVIFLVPARFEDCNVPDRISRYQWVDLFEQHGYQKLKDSLQMRMNDLNIRFDLNEILPETDSDMFTIPIVASIEVNSPFPKLKETGFGLTKKYAENFIEVARGLLPSREKDKELYALKVKGSSMIDAMINDGDIVVMKPAVTAKNGDMVAVWLPDRNETTLKYFYKEKDGYRLQPANPSLKPIMIRKSEPLEIKGKVVMVIRKA